MENKFIPMGHKRTSVFLNCGGGFDVRACPDAEALAEYIKIACNGFPSLVVHVQQLTDDLDDARKGLAAADKLNGQLMEVLKVIAAGHGYPAALATDTLGAVEAKPGSRFNICNSAAGYKDMGTWAGFNAKDALDAMARAHGYSDYDTGRIHLGSDLTITEVK